MKNYMEKEEDWMRNWKITEMLSKIQRVEAERIEKEVSKKAMESRSRRKDLS